MYKRSIRKSEDEAKRKEELDADPLSSSSHLLRETIDLVEELRQNDKENKSLFVLTTFQLSNQFNQFNQNLTSLLNLKTTNKTVLGLKRKHAAIASTSVFTNNKLFKFCKAIYDISDIIFLTILILLFSSYLAYFLNVYFSPNPRDRVNLNKKIEKSFNWVVAQWMHFNGFTDLSKEECALVAPDIFNSILRPVDDCSMCENLHQIDRISKIEKETFLDKYAYTGVPVVITDAISHWPAMKSFSFDFLKNLYLNMTNEEELDKKRKRKSKIGSYGGNENVSPLLNTFSSMVESDAERASRLANNRDTCQFFPYKTKFKSLKQVFELERDSNNNFASPWYVGWSNCNNHASKILRQHYMRPHFLPDESEMSRLDWIFMGTTGYGAEMHVDDVQNPSWQAQITGVKKWIFRPPAECMLKCKYSLNASVHPGDIIIFDSNRWFHSTEIVGNDLSLTIGSEYD